MTLGFNPRQHLSSQEGSSVRLLCFRRLKLHILHVCSGRWMFPSPMGAGKGTLTPEQPPWDLAQPSAKQTFDFGLLCCRSLGTYRLQSSETPCELRMCFSFAYLAPL